MSFNRPDIKSEGLTSKEPRVVKSEAPVTRTVASFELQPLKIPGQGTYSATRERYGALAATDADRGAATAKGFSLNSLARDPLAVDAEEKRVIAERVKTQVAAMAEEARKNAAQEGYRDGLAKGHEEAFLKFRAEASERMASLEGLISGFENAKAEIFRANERFLMDLIFRISRMVLLREASTDRELVLRLARALIERMGVRDNIRMRIHADDATSVGMLKEGLEKSLGTLKNLNIEVSDTVERGGCHVETEWNAIDASLETQLNGIYEALIGESLPKASAPTGEPSEDPAQGTPSAT